jgi:hypothetical protein
MPMPSTPLACRLAGESSTPPLAAALQSAGTASVGALASSISWMGRAGAASPPMRTSARAIGPHTAPSTKG